MYKFSGIHPSQSKAYKQVYCNFHWIFERTLRYQLTVEVGMFCGEMVRCPTKFFLVVCWNMHGYAWGNVSRSQSGLWGCKGTSRKASSSSQPSGVAFEPPVVVELSLLIAIWLPKWITPEGDEETVTPRFHSPAQGSALPSTLVWAWNKDFTLQSSPI